MSPEQGTAARILVVDDDRASSDELVERLRLRRFEVLLAETGKHGLEMVKGQRPDLVLLDADLHGMSGLDVVRDIRKSFCAAELPVIIMADNNDHETMVAGIGGGANDCIAKPVDLEALLVRMGVQLNVRASFRKALSEQARLQRRLHTRARLEEFGYGDPHKLVYMMNELHRDLVAGKVQLLFQPQYRMRTGDIMSAEALMRWKNDTLGDVPAHQFISLAEETGDIRLLTEWAVDQALAAHGQFLAAGHHVRISVNLSATLVGDAAFVDTLLDKIGARTSGITLELTESAIFDNGERAVLNLTRLSEAGVRLAIDDYGTGMSSLSYIQQLPVNELKIDRMFVSKLTSSHRDPLLVRSTIDLAHALELEVVAEGVEHAETLALLSVMGCDIAQGYFVGKPMTADKFLEFLKSDARTKLGAPFDVSAFLRRALNAS